MTSDEAVSAFNSGKPVWITHSKPRALITAIEKITDGLVRVTVHDSVGLHCAAHLQTTRDLPIRSKDSNSVNRKFFEGLMKALSDD